MNKEQTEGDGINEKAFAAQLKRNGAAASRKFREVFGENESWMKRNTSTESIDFGNGKGPQPYISTLPWFLNGPEPLPDTNS